MDTHTRSSHVILTLAALAESRSALAVCDTSIKVDRSVDTRTRLSHVTLILAPLARFRPVLDCKNTICDKSNQNVDKRLILCKYSLWTLTQDCHR